MKIKFYKFNENAVLPKHAKPGDAGVDLTCINKEYDFENNLVIYDTGLGIEIPENHVGLLFPRSSVYKVQLTMANCVGVIDQQYTGVIKAMYKSWNNHGNSYQIGDRVAQLVIVPYVSVEAEWTNDIRQTERGQSGLGSTGK